MRTSGRSLDPIALVPLLVAVVALVMLAGGPSEFLLAIERMMRSSAAAASEWLGRL